MRLNGWADLESLALRVKWQDKKDRCMETL
jgi:hypothetical protein